MTGPPEWAYAEAGRLCRIRQEFRKSYHGGSTLVEVVPEDLAGGHAGALHSFARHNPMYDNSYGIVVEGTSCMVHVGDINRYWLGSITHQASRAPFSPTWLSSAMLLASCARHMGYRTVVDVGSGDGRIAYCAVLLDMCAYSMELDPDLAGLQGRIISGTGICFDTVCADATTHNYAQLDLERPAFFIGGLAQMGGATLASAILDYLHDGRIDAGFVLAGTYSKKYADTGHAGWAPVMRDRRLEHEFTMALPTAWTFNEPDDTPYVFARTVWS